MNFKDKHIAILGAGVEGVSSAKFFSGHGARVTLLDQKEREVSGLGNVKTRFGPTAFENLHEYDLLVRSPGIQLSHDELKDIPKEKITSQTKLFLDLCSARVIGVTGTKGKGTTAALIYEMLKASGMDVYLGGNIGTPPFAFLDKLTEKSIVVLELSSYQLADLAKSPHIAVFLMIVPDHLHYHGDMAEYVDAKRNILRFQTSEDFAVINRDYPASNESDVHTDAKVFSVSRERPSTDQGCFVKDDAIWIRMQGPVIGRSAPQGVQGTEWKIIDTKDIFIPGKHNLENVCAASMAATLAGATKSEIVRVLKSFKGLPHRLELVGEVNGVRYYDDSIATNPESAIAAIEAFQQPKILVLGGVTEGSSFEELGKVIAGDPTVKAVIGFGKDWPLIKEAILRANAATLLIEGAKDMNTVIAAAAKIAKPGDVVLLSPACKSFDMFKDYQERGDQFKEEVRKL